VVSVTGARRFGIDARDIRAAARSAIAVGLPPARGEVAVVLVDDTQIRRLNGAYRGKDRPTDVLSFDVGDGLTPGEPLGDIVVSVPTARRQAREYGATLADELRRLVVHGALHLCGFDHQTREDAARMHGLTRRLLARLGRVRGRPKPPARKKRVRS
jgi:probable rRNA maturation factor